MSTQTVVTIRTEDDPHDRARLKTALADAVRAATGSDEPVGVDWLPLDEA